MAEKKKGQLTPQEMLRVGIDGVLNSNPVTAIPNMIRNTLPHVGPIVKEGGKIINSAVDAVPGAKEVLNHPAVGVVTQAVPPLGPILTTAGVASQTAGGERATNPFKGKDGKDEKPAAPPQAADSPTPRGQNLPPSAAVPGTGPKGNTVGSDADPDTPGLQGPGAPKGDTRVTPDGLVSYGRDLSSLNQFSKTWLGDDYEIADIKSAFQSNDLEGAYQNGSNSISTEESKYTLEPGATPSNAGGKYAMDGVDTSVTETGYKIDGKSVPGTVGGNANNPQDGTSEKPDVAEEIRRVRMARTEGSPRGFNGADFSGSEPDSASLTSPMYKNSRRNAIRSTFLDYEGSSVKAVAAANAKAGYGKDSNGNARFNYGGELVNAKDGMEWKAKDAAMKGLDPSEFLDIKIKEVKDTQKDSDETK